MPKRIRKRKEFPFKFILFGTLSSGFLVVVGRKGLMGLFTKSAKADIKRNLNKNPKVLIDCALLRNHAHPHS